MGTDPHAHARSGDDDAQGVCGRKSRGPFGTRRIDPFGVDPGFQPFCFGTGKLYLAVPSFGINCAPWTQIEARDVLLLAVGYRIHPEQIRRDVVASGAPEILGVLAAHHGAVAVIIRRGIGNITGRIDVRVTDDLQVPIDMKTSESIFFRVDLLR